MDNFFLNEACRHSSGFHTHYLLWRSLTTKGKGWIVSYPFYVGLDQGFSTLALLAFGAGGFFVVRAALCTLTCLALSLASNHRMLVAPPTQLGQPKICRDIARCPLENKVAPV